MESQAETTGPMTGRHPGLACTIKVNNMRVCDLRNPWGVDLTSERTRLNGESRRRRRRRGADIPVHPRGVCVYVQHTP